MNRFGSFVNEKTGAQGKKCADRKRLAVLYVYDINGPLYEFAVSPSNLKLWNEHVHNISGRGIPLRGLVTRALIPIRREPAASCSKPRRTRPAPGSGMCRNSSSGWSPRRGRARSASGRSGRRDRCPIVSWRRRPGRNKSRISLQTHVAPGTYQPLTAEGAAMLNRAAPLAAQPVAATPTTSAPTQAAPTSGASPSEAQSEGSARRPRRTKAQMEADRKAKEAASAGQPSTVAAPAAFGAGPSSGNPPATNGSAPAASGAFGAAPPAFGMPDIPASMVRTEQAAAFGGTAGIRAPDPAAAAFGVATSVPAASAEVDAMLAQVMGQAFQ